MILYHRTDDFRAVNRILKNDLWESKENTKEAFFSTVKSGENIGYGKYLIEIDVPDHLCRLDDEFPDGEQHYAVKINNLQFFNAYLVEE